MEAKKIKISALRLNDDNPRIIKDHKFQKLIKSILTFPEMLSLREIVADETMSVLGGNMSDNARIEQYLYENNRETFLFHKEWMSDLIKKTEI